MRNNQKPALLIWLTVFFGLTAAGCGPTAAEPLPVPTEPAGQIRTQTAAPDPTSRPIDPTAEKPTHTPTAPAPDSEADQVGIGSGAEKISQLVGDYDRERQAPTRNLTQQRYRLDRTDLGIPFQHKGRTYLLFGDAWDPPDDPIAYTTDTNPEDGLDLVFLQNDTGRYHPIRVPGISLGTYEVPSEGVSVNERMFIYVTTDHSEEVVMGRSAVAVSDDDGYSFSYLYDLSTEHFINVSVVKTDLARWEGFPESEGTGLVVFGSGRYRESDVRLAFQPADEIENPDQIRYFAGFDQQNQPRWSGLEEDARALFQQPCVGEFSVSYNRFIEQWIMLYNCGFEEARGINLRTGPEPWGPWSEPVILFDPWDDGGYCHFMHVDWEYRNCDQVHDPGRENEWGGEYGPYQLEGLAVGGPSATTIYFTMSTWNPYTVVLMKASLEKH